MKKNKDFALFAFFSIYFISLGMSSFASKYLGEIGFSDSQIGLTASVPAALCLFAQPMFGIISDRIKLKRNLLVVTCILAGMLYVVVNFATQFLPILILLTITNIILCPSSPIASSIALENERNGGSSFGAIRLSGTIGYQVGALVIGFILVTSLNGIYAIMGVLTVLAGVACIFFPAIKGHQYGNQKVSYLSIFKDKKATFLLAILFLASLGSAFYRSFFTKYLGDLGIANSMISIITVISICLEIPFLFFSKKLYTKLSIWSWVLLGLGLNGIRMIGLGLSGGAMAVLLVNLPCVSVMACFEFFPAIYLNDHVNISLRGSAQSTLSLVNYSLGQIIGCFIGGIVSDYIGIGNVFVCFGIIYLITFAVVIIPCLKINREEMKS